MLLVKQSGFKIFTSFMVLSLLFALTMPNFVKAKEFKNSEETSFNEDKYFAIFDEMLKKGIDLENLSSNTQKDINKLSSKAKKFYSEYEIVMNDDEKVLEYIAILEASENTTTTNGDGIYTPMMNVDPGDGGALISHPDGTIFISHDTISKLNKVSGLSGSMLGVFSALVKYYTGMLPKQAIILAAAIYTLGLAALNTCDWNDKGVYISAQFFGSPTAPLATVTCRAAK